MKTFNHPKFKLSPIYVTFLIIILINRIINIYIEKMMKFQYEARWKNAYR